MKQRKNPGARGGSPSGGAGIPKQQECRSKTSTEAEEGGRRMQGGMKEKARSI